MMKIGGEILGNRLVFYQKESVPFMYRLGVILIIVWGGIMITPTQYHSVNHAAAHETSGSLRTPMTAILPEIASEFDALLTLLGIDDETAIEEHVFDAKAALRAAQNRTEKISLSPASFAYRPLSARRSSVIHGENFGKPIRKNDPSMRDELIYSHRIVPPRVMEAIKKLSPDHARLQDSTPGYP